MNKDHQPRHKEERTMPPAEFSLKTTALGYGLGELERKFQARPQNIKRWKYVVSPPEQVADMIREEYAAYLESVQQLLGTLEQSGEPLPLLRRLNPKATGMNMDRYETKLAALMLLLDTLDYDYEILDIQEEGN